MAHSSRTWTGARTPQAIKRVRQAASRHAVLQPRRSAAKTFVAKAVSAAQGADANATREALLEAVSALDKAAKVGAIHRNAAARRKSRLMLKINAALEGVSLTAGSKTTRPTGKVAAAKQAKQRIAAGKATKAKGEQTAAGKARAALSRSTRAGTATAATTEPAAETPSARANSSRTTAKAPAKSSAAKSATGKSATAKTAPTKPASSSSRGSSSKASPAKTSAAKSAAKSTAKSTAKAAPKAAARKSSSTKS